MNRRVLIGIGALLVIVVIAGALLYNAVLGETEEASGPISAIPLELATATNPPTPPTEVPAAATEVPAAATEVPTEAPAAAPTEAPVGAGLQRYQIVSAESQAIFRLGEILNGSPFTVVGTTDQVAGELAIDQADLSTAQIGPILINARTIATDSGQRDRAIRNVVLSTDQFEFITFTPSAIEGLSGSGTIGQAYSFTISGDLTIRDVTLPVSFNATVTAESAERLSGNAIAVINRNDYGLTIPSVPSVANVDEQVELEIVFSAALVP